MNNEQLSACGRTVRYTAIALALTVTPLVLSAQETTSFGPMISSNLSGQVYSTTAVEIFWPGSADADTSYNVFRNGEQIDEFSIGLSFFDRNLEPNTGYSYCVYAIVQNEIVDSGDITLFTADDGSGSAPTPPSGSCPLQPIIAGATPLTASIYSSTVLEVFWGRDADPAIRYSLYRDGLPLTSNSASTSYFESSLAPDTSYVYCLYDIANNVVRDAEAITVTTLDNGTGAEPTPAAGTCPVGLFIGGPDISRPVEPEIGPVIPVEPIIPVDEIEITGVVYSSTALEVFWVRATTPNGLDDPTIMYNIFRDGQLLLTNTAASSLFQTDLLQGTTYEYVITAVSNGDTLASSALQLTTNNR